ncbi:hypothetical protein OCK72_11140 [Fusobacterium simiae]|uniref:Uncharacterized protein n=1 Tax=Fusobacterium simiae TaxID=855 RepID=A0ABT4DKP6_FUSSI|nr:hypothetical protein [Fusobacterium simiae]MCY7009176.1 hypothetical protein [Fusobacterium simiae]
MNNLEHTLKEKENEYNLVEEKLKVLSKDMEEKESEKIKLEKEIFLLKE